jgi:hypothetical protein
MTDRTRATSRTRDQDPVADLPLDDVVEVQGDVPPVDQDAVLDPDELESARQPTLTELDDGYPSPDPVAAGSVADALDGLDLDDLREGETDDPKVATEEGLTYVPPIDPPVRADADDEEGVIIAAGPAVSAESEPYDDDHRSSDLSSEGDLTERIRSALRADAATAGLVDRVVIGTRGSTAVVRGVVDDLSDGDALMEVIERVDGVETVIDQTELPV